MIPLVDVQAILKPQGYAAQYASTEMFPLFENDLDDADKYELGRTHHQDWRKELHDTLDSAATTFCVTSADHGGALIFGVTPFPGNAGRMWMLQSRSFVAEAGRVYGARFAHKMGAISQGMIALFLQHHTPLFNFIPGSQTRNIRWLKLGGFAFFRHPHMQTDILFFGQGAGVETLAADQRIWASCLGAALVASKEDQEHRNSARKAG
jgi:hypothetical protein